MDGPNVNLAFIKEFNLEFSSDVKLLDIGSCGLHRLHCAFKAGMCAVPWDIVSYLRVIYNLFKDVPVRRALYTQYSESNIFPLKFCSIRWLENSEVAQRAIDITPHIKKFVEDVRKDNIEPTCKSYILVAKFIKDPLLCARFFQVSCLQCGAFFTRISIRCTFSSFSAYRPLSNAEDYIR